MAAKKQLIQAMSNRITRQFDEAELKKYTEHFDMKTITLSCKNTRNVAIHMYIPADGNTSGKVFYAYEFIDHQGRNDHYTLSDIAKEILQLGYANEDISGHSPDELADMGFVAESGTNLCAISNMLRSDNYKLVTTGKTYYGPEHDTGHDGQPYFGPIYQDVFTTENLTVFDKVIAHRDVKIGSRCVRDYVGD